MTLPKCKTKIVCTIGPASDSQDVLERMIRTGMNVARLNFSHGDFESHARVVQRVRTAAAAVGRRVTLMADLPGPKMRIGMLADEPITLKPGDAFTLTTDDITGTASRVSVTLKTLPQSVRPGNTLFLNDGLIQLEVSAVSGNDIACTVLVGGELRSKKGLNIPGINLGMSAFTDRDREWLAIAKQLNIDAVSQSFVDSAQDIEDLRAAARALDYKPFIIAKIERLTALQNIDEILAAANGIMIARGDLGVEIPIEEIALVQKLLMKKANLLGKPVITATQMLESMTTNPRPTRAESTDVANAILDGTDCVMLSGESAMGSYPVDAVGMLAKIGAAVEQARPAHAVREQIRISSCNTNPKLSDIIALSVETTLQCTSPAAVFVPTRSGATARSIARFRMPVWIVAVSSQEATCQGLQFSYGVWPEHEPDHPERWGDYAKQWLCRFGIGGNLVIFTEGPSSKYPDMNNKMEIIDLTREVCRISGQDSGKRG
ncbi:MAG TPA: pyruvate kinase [Dissulfurispiraceae bacterium]|nr:pyruvate kinase [Dissulfurispiraceae bacterium]